MTEPLEKKSPRVHLKRRQLEIERCLAEHGLARGPRRVLPNTSAEDSLFERLAAALASLGPVFSSFGIYLSSRADLMSAQDCLEMAILNDRAEPMPIEIIRGLIRREIGCPPSEAYSVIEEEPFESRLMFQLHHASLHNGEAVTVKVVRPDFEEQLARDSELLSLLKSGFVGAEYAELPIEAAISDFRRTLQQQLNLMHEVEMMETLAHQMTEIGSLRVPAVHRKFSASKVLTIERLSESTLNNLTAAMNEPDPKNHEKVRPLSAINGSDLRDAATRLCLLWLRLALEGRLFPVEPRAEHFMILTNNQIAFTGGPFATLPSETKANLFDYLIAASTQDPDRACSCLIKETRKDAGAVSEDALRHKFRQVVPFRDGGWSTSGASDSLAEHLFLHWRLASRHGYRPGHHLLSFYRGLFWIANSTRSLTAGHDAFLEALEDLRLNAAMSQVREMMSLSTLTDTSDKYATMMMELPRKVDQALTLMAEGTALLKLDGARIAGRQRQQTSSAVVIALLMLMVALAVLSRHLSTAVAGVWVDRVSAIAFILLGALLLRVARSSQ